MAGLARRRLSWRLKWLSCLMVQKMFLPMLVWTTSSYCSYPCQERSNGQNLFRFFNGVTLAWL